VDASPFASNMVLMKVAFPSPHCTPAEDSAIFPTIAEFVARNTPLQL
jgi:hypothetical protein